MMLARGSGGKRPTEVSSRIHGGIGILIGCGWRFIIDQDDCLWDGAADGLGYYSSTCSVER